jgi:hypothetical protein
MGLSSDFLVFGIHSMVPYKRTDKMPYGILKILGGGTMSLSAEFEELFGGSNRYAWASEPKTISSEFTCSVKSLPDFLLELYLAAEVSTIAASTTGTAGSFANALGTTVFKATTGIATVTVKTGSEADLKSGTYIIKAISANTVDVFAATDVDFSRGTDLVFVDDLLKITTTPITIATTVAVTVPNLGIELTGGSSVTALTIGDTAIFKVVAPHGGVSDVIIGKSSAIFPEHGLFCQAAKRSDGSLFEMDLHKCVGAGFPIALEETTFSIPELTIKVLYDSSLDRIATFRKVKGA